MDLQEMREEVLDALGLDVGDSGEYERIDKYLSRVYSYEIPDRVGDACVEQIVALAVSSAQVDLSTYRIRAVRRLAYIGETSLGVFTDAEYFFNEVVSIGTVAAQPVNILVQGNLATFDPAPNTTYTVSLWATCYRAALTSTGISDVPQAWATVYGAAYYLALQKGMDAAMARMRDAHEQHLAMLLSRHHARSAGELPGDF